MAAPKAFARPFAEPVFLFTKARLSRSIPIFRTKQGGFTEEHFFGFPAFTKGAYFLYETGFLRFTKHPKHFREDKKTEGVNSRFCNMDTMTIRQLDLQLDNYN